MRLRVRLAGWELEECGWTIRVGDEVSWLLVFQHPRAQGYAPEPETQDLLGEAIGLDWDWGEARLHPTRLAVGSVSLYWDAPQSLAGSVEVRGRIHRGDQTGEAPADFPATRGVVRRLWMVNATLYEGGPNRVIEPDPEVYEEVAESRIIWSREYFGDDGRALIWTGVLAELDIKT